MVRLCTRAALCGLTGISFLFLAGCVANKPKQEPPPIPDGPVTSLESPEHVQLKELPAGAGEPDLVELVVYYRSMYARSLRGLRDHYREKGEHTKAIWAENELRQVWQIKPYSYIMDVEVPSATQPAEESVEGADELYNQGVRLLQQASETKAKENRELLSRALASFKQLVQKYPTSDKVDKASYYVGMIHYHYFPDDAQIALAWYKRAYTLNPKIMMPARYESARIYDDRLKDRSMALEMYREVLKHEKFNKANYDYATNRVVALTTRGEDKAKDAMRPVYKQ